MNGVGNKCDDCGTPLPDDEGGICDTCAWWRAEDRAREWFE